jgi:hypothetical protein
VFVVTDDEYPGNIQWAIDGYISNGLAHDTRVVDLSNHNEGCIGIGGGVAYLAGRGSSEFVDCTIQHASAIGGSAGGAFHVATSFGANFGTNLSTQLAVRSSHFEIMDSELVPWIYSDRSKVLVENTLVLLTSADEDDEDKDEDKDEDAAVGEVFVNNGGEASCVSSCPAGQYGLCQDLNGCGSCEKDVCLKCPPGHYSSDGGAVSINQCLTCEEGKFAIDAGSPSCVTCAAGHYVSDDPSDADGIGLGKGGTVSEPLSPTH